ncbi:MAG: transglutaminase domain-containing protein [Candidatus Binatia bacterium]
MTDDRFLRPTPIIDSDHPAVIAYARAAAGDATDPRERAIRLYHEVRDDVVYDPYGLGLDVAGMRASATLANRRGWCVAKAALLAACARAEGIPARLGFADVRNHLSTEKLRAAMGTDLFVFHGNTELLLDGRWVKATPAFNKELCAKFGVPPLEWDGVHDSLLQAHDGAKRTFMEYVRDRGSYDDVPLDEILAAFREHYPTMFPGAGAKTLDGNFGAEGAAERGAATAKGRPA